MKALGISGSPRVGGNTDYLVGRVLAGAAERGAHGDRVSLRDLEVRPCAACARCGESGECATSDDFPRLLARMKEADAIVLGSPVWCGTVTAQMKALIDRADQSQVVMEEGPDSRTRFRSRLPAGKRGAIVVAADLGPKEAIESTVRVLERFLKDLGVEIVGALVASRLRARDDAAKDALLLERAFDLGTRLVS
jgi:multimeric flavodoxin WrbA